MRQALAARLHDDGEVGQLLVYMPILVRSSEVTEWERNFCASIIHQTRGSGRPPSDKQIGIMRRLVAKFQATMRQDMDVIERGQSGARE